MSTPTTVPSAPKVDLDPFFPEPHAGLRLPSPIVFDLGCLERLETGLDMDISAIGDRLNAMSAKGPDGKAQKPAFSIRFVRSFIRAATGAQNDWLEPAKLIPIFNALVGGFGQAIAQMTPAEAKAEEAPKGN